MDINKNRTTVTGITPLAVAVLEYGKAIIDIHPGHPFKPGAEGKCGEADDEPVTKLLGNTQAARKHFTFHRGLPDPMEVRVFSVVAHEQVMTDGPSQVRRCTEYAGGGICIRILEARRALHRLVVKGTLTLRDAPGEKPWNTLVALSPASVSLLGLRQKSAPILFTNKMVNTEAGGIPADPLADIPTPADLAARVNLTVLGMPGIVSRLSTQIVMHMRRGKLIRDGKDCPGLNNTAICLIGESGTGKTFVIQELSKATGLPFGSSAAPDFSITGFVGLNADDALRPVLAAAGNNPALARHGVCFVDEWDKLRPMDSSGSMHVSTTGVVHSFLRLMEGSEVICNAKRSSNGCEMPVTVSTVGTCFAFSGVFKGLREELGRKGTSRIGFDSHDGGRAHRKIQDAMTSWGMPREWVNRLSLIQFIPPPDHSLIVEVAASVIVAYNQLLASDGKSFSLTGEAVRELASYALESKGYSRAVKMVISRCCEIVMGDGGKGTAEFGLEGIRNVISAIGEGT